MAEPNANSEIRVLDALRELGGRFRNKETVHALVGAGLSAGAGLPSWVKLLDMLESPPKQLTPSGSDEAVQPPARDERANADLPWRAQLIEKTRGRDVIRNHLKQALLQKDVTLSASLRSVVRLPFQHVLTTNYDDLLDRAHAEVSQGKASKVLRWDVPGERFQFIESLGRPSPIRYYVHLHGRADIPESCVITEEDYRDRYVRSETLARNLYALFASQTVVFIGFSLADRDFVEILREVQAHGGGHARHYAILPRPKDGEAGLTAYLLGKFGVAPILYPNTNDRHEGLAVVLRDLETLAVQEHDWAFVDVTKPLANGSPPNPNDPNAGHFGGLSERNGYSLLVRDIVNWSDHWATFILAVERVDGADVTQPIAFYLHPTFREVMVRVVPENGKATLKLHSWGAFTVGAVVGDSGTLLELDLEAEPRFSEIFRSR